MLGKISDILAIVLFNFMPVLFSYTAAAAANVRLGASCARLLLCICESEVSFTNKDLSSRFPVRRSLVQIMINFPSMIYTANKQNETHRRSFRLAFGFEFSSNAQQRTVQSDMALGG